MSRAYLVVCTFLLAPTAFAADPEIPAEKRKAVIDAVVAKKPKGDEDLAARVKALDKAKINPKLTSNRYPDDPTQPASFTSQLGKEKYAERITKELAELREEQKKYAENPLAFAPSLKGIDKGEIGLLDHHLCVVGKVLDERQAVITISIINLAGGRNQKMNVLLTGIDTGNLADGKGYRLKGVFYVPGNAKAGGETMMQLVPFEPTTEERMKLGMPTPKEQKK